jgi:intracellular sulfur oxidation DsrE/DsrF family protein
VMTTGLLSAQNTKKGNAKKPKTHKIIFQMVSKDTADHSAMVRQLYNLQRLAPGTKLEVVCHGPGMNFIHKANIRSCKRNPRSGNRKLTKLFLIL